MASYVAVIEAGAHSLVRMLHRGCSVASLKVEVQPGLKIECLLDPVFSRAG